MSHFGSNVFKGRGRGMLKQAEKIVGMCRNQQVFGQTKDPLLTDTYRDANFNIVLPDRMDTHESTHQPCDPDDCEICHRPVKLIVCRACGHTFQGRVRTKCPIHPEVIHLMDCSSCPNCTGVNLKEFS